MVPHTTRQTIRYSRDHLLSLQNSNKESGHFDWDYISQTLHPHCNSQTKRIKARITRSLGEYTDKIIGKPSNNLVTLPTYASVINSNQYCTSAIEDSKHSNSRQPCMAKITREPKPNTAKTNNCNPMPNIFATNLQRQTLDKHHELSGLIENNSYDILLLTETWFTKATENLYNIQGFQKLTSNRSPSRVGGGVAIYCSSKYSAKKLDSFTSTTMSALCTLIKVPEICTPMICGVLYHPPGLRKEQRDQTTE